MSLDFNSRDARNLIQLIKGQNVNCYGNYNGNLCKVTGYNPNDKSVMILVGGDSGETMKSFCKIYAIHKQAKQDKKYSNINFSNNFLN